MAIGVVTGLPGHGKGIWCCSLIEQAAKAGRPVYTNIQLNDSCPYVDRVALIDTEEYPVYRGRPEKPGKKASADYQAFWRYIMPGAVCIIDEADGYFDCSDHSDMGRDVRLFHKQIRKLDLDIIYVVQKLPNLYVRIRRMAERFTVCDWSWRSGRIHQRLVPFVGLRVAMGLSKFIRDEFGDEEFSRRTHLGSGFFKYAEAMRFFNWYNTNQLVGDLAHLPVARKMMGVGSPQLSDDQADALTDIAGRIGDYPSDGERAFAAAAISEVLDADGVSEGAASSA